MFVHRCVIVALICPQSGLKKGLQQASASSPSTNKGPLSLPKKADIFITLLPGHWNRWYTPCWVCVYSLQDQFGKTVQHLVLVGFVTCILSSATYCLWGQIKISWFVALGLPQVASKSLQQVATEGDVDVPSTKSNDLVPQSIRTVAKLSATHARRAKTRCMPQ